MNWFPAMAKPNGIVLPPDRKMDGKNTSDMITTRNMYQRIYYTLKLLQNNTLHYLTSSCSNEAMPRFSTALFYCPFKVHDQV